VRDWSEWDTLAEALERLIAAGEPEDDAKSRLCRAMVARWIGIRLTVISNTGGWVYGDFDFRVPSTLSPSDLDWTESRPVVAWWVVRPTEWTSYRIDLVEVLTSDVSRLCHGPYFRLRTARDIDRTAVSAAGLPRRISKREAQKFTQDYIRDEKQRGAQPRLAGLEATAKEAGLRGGREFFRDEFRRIEGPAVMRGRPRKDNSPKN
jgi:hypothetical protein